MLNVAPWLLLEEPDEYACSCYEQRHHRAKLGFQQEWVPVKRKLG